MSCRAERRRRRGARSRAGFTLIELIVVVAIIATLAAVIAPAIFRNVGDSKTAAAQSQVELFAMALGSYRLDNDVFPSTQQGLEALRTQPTTGDLPRRWRGPYLSKVLAPDPWGRAWIYVSPGRANPQTFDLYTLGRDGRLGGSGEDADVTSWGGPVQQ